MTAARVRRPSVAARLHASNAVADRAGQRAGAVTLRCLLIRSVRLARGSGPGPPEGYAGPSAVDDGVVDGHPDAARAERGPAIESGPGMPAVMVGGEAPLSYPPIW